MVGFQVLKYNNGVLVQLTNFSSLPNALHIKILCNITVVATTGENGNKALEVCVAG